MLKALLRDAVVYGASTVLTRAVSLLVVPIYTRILSPAEYGAIDILSIFGNLITLTVALEIGQAVARFLPDAESDPDRRRLVSTATIFGIVAYSGFVAAALLLVEPLRDLLIGEEASTTAVVMAITAIWSIGIFQLVQNVLRFLIRPMAFTVASLLFALGGLAVGVVLVVVFDAGVAGVFAGQTVGGVVGSVAAILFARNLYRPIFSTPALRQMLGFSIPLVPAGLGVFVTLYIDRIALNQLSSLAAVGIFGIGYRLGSVVSLILIGVQMALMPIVYQRYRDPSTPAELARVFRVFVAFALLVGMGLSIWAPEILRVFTTPDYYAAGAVVPLLTPAVLLANMYVFMPGLAIAKQTRTIGVITIAGAVLNTALNLLLIPILDVRGAALATLLSATAIFVAYVRTSQRTYPVPHRWGPLLVAVALYVPLVWVGASAAPMSVPGLAVKVGVMAALAWIVIATRLVTRDELVQVVRFARNGVAARR